MNSLELGPQVWVGEGSYQPCSDCEMGARDAVKRVPGIVRNQRYNLEKSAGCPCRR